LAWQIHLKTHGFMDFSANCAAARCGGCGRLWGRRLADHPVRDHGAAGVDAAGLRFVIVLVLTGFPIALILAWAFDVGSEIQRATSPLAA
jgi:hypothetical protein